MHAEDGLINHSILSVASDPESALMLSVSFSLLEVVKKVIVHTQVS